MMEHEIWKCDVECLDFWRRLLDIIQEKDCDCRYKPIWDNEVSRWGELIEPVEGYIEGWSGPAAKWEVEWIEIDPITEENVELIDCTEQICEKLTSEGIKYEIINHFIRIKTTPESHQLPHDHRGKRQRAND